MAKAVVTFGAAVPRAADGAAQVLSAYPRATEELSTSGTSAASTITAGPDYVAQVYLEVAGWVTFGAAPVAAVGEGFFIPADSQREFGGLRNGHKMAVINDS